MTVGLTPHSSVDVDPGIAKHGSLIALPTIQRHASLRYGAAIELAKQEPCSTGVELATLADGAYANTSVAAGWVEPVEVEAEFAAGAFAAGLEYAKNCPTPNRMTSKRTMIIKILRFVSLILPYIT